MLVQPLSPQNLPILESLVDGADPEVIDIEVIRESNARCRDIDGLVAVFVGGTSGIGESTVKELFMRTQRPRAYIVGRNETNGQAIVDELHRLNPEGQANFIQKDVSLLRNVDELAADLKQREKKINCLFITAGYMSLGGRNETPEGIDRKMCVNYYARIRCTLALMPLLSAASKAKELSRVITVLAAGSEANVNLDDLDLRNTFTLQKCLAHCVVMSDFAIMELARRYPQTSFSHSYPGTVKTGIANELTGPARLATKLFYSLMTPWILNVRESGERHFFQITSQCYPPGSGQRDGVGIPCPEGLGQFVGADGNPASGGYLLDWDGRPTGDEGVLRPYREMNVGKIVWEHTMAMFAQADRLNAASAKRAAVEQLEDEMRAFPDPPGWRTG